MCSIGRKREFANNLNRFDTVNIENGTTTFVWNVVLWLVVVTGIYGLEAITQKFYIYQMDYTDGLHIISERFECDNSQVNNKLCCRISFELRWPEGKLNCFVKKSDVYSLLRSGQRNNGSFEFYSNCCCTGFHFSVILFTFYLQISPMGN